MKLYLPDGDGGYKEVEIEGETCVINIENIIEDQTPPYELPTMNRTLKGGAAVGIGLYMTGNTLNATPYVLPTMNESVKGGAKVGDGLYMINDQLNLLPMSERTRGGAKVGGGLYMVNDQLNLQTMSENIKGGAKVGEGLYMTGDTLNAKQLKFGDGFDTVDDTIEFDPLKKIPLGDGLHLDDDGNLAADTVAPFPALGNGLKLNDDVLEVDPFEVLPTLGNGFSIDDGGLNFDPLEVIPLGEGLTLSPAGALTVDPTIFPTASGGGGGGGGDTVLVENPYALPTMSQTLKGGAKVGIGLYMTDETLNVDFPEIKSYCQEYIEQTIDESISGSSGAGHNLGVTVHDSIPPNTELSIPYCVLDFKTTSGVNPDNPGLPGSENWIYSHCGALVLDAEYMNIDFKVYGDNMEEIVFRSVDLESNTEPSGIDGWGTTLSPYADTGAVVGTNIATTKTLANGGTTIYLADRMADQLTEGYIWIMWGTKSEIGNVKFKSAEIVSHGNLETGLPTDPQHGTLCYRGSSLYLYSEDKKKWLKWAVTATNTL